MISRLVFFGLFALALAAPAAAELGDVLFLPGATAEQVAGDRPALDLLTWDLRTGLLVVDRRPSGQPPLGAEPFTPRYADAEWYLVDRTRRAGGGAFAAPADPAAFGHVHLAAETAWVVEVPRARLDAFHVAGFGLQFLDRSAVAAAPRSRADGRSWPAPATVDAAVKAAYVDDLDQMAYDQFLREISGDSPFWYGGAAHTVATRYYTTAGNDLVASYLAQKFAGYGYGVELDAFTVNGHPCQNVVATKTGTVYPDEIVVVGGHYDSTSQQPGSLAPGAEDNGSGTCLVMEIARVSAGRNFERTVQFVLFDAEEPGLRGSQHFVAEAVAAGRTIVGAITADMVSYYDRNVAVIIEGQSAWEWLMTAMAENVVAYTTIGHRKDYYSWGSDHVPFQQAGIAAFLAIDMDYDSYPYYHRTTDTWSAIQPTVPIALQISRAAAATLADVAGLVAAPTAAPETPVPLVRLAAHPNPFNPQTTLSFSLDVPTRGELVIHDLRGRKVATLAAGALMAGEHAVTWRGVDDGGRSLPSGVYIAGLATGAGTTSLELNLVR
ncbi:MAG TPA: M28 family peptidase [Candidatus Krumholzibacteria bacterium]|nr:M28 family peptidase [Candidatus Krumholzibacteria bacterium]HPD70371.1 M28 family peptidase [Candidatus Krumholzibacteria bacterium]HRY39929.1 M28 family peptidase [Candidatus Krumholzibacteria bacterium]